MMHLAPPAAAQLPSRIPAGAPDFAAWLLAGRFAPNGPDTKLSGAGHERSGLGGHFWQVSDQLGRKEGLWQTVRKHLESARTQTMPLVNGSTKITALACRPRGRRLSVVA